MTDAFGGAGGIACYNRDLLSALSGQERVRNIRLLTRQGDAVQVDDKLQQLSGRPGRLAYSLAALRNAFSLRPDRILCGHIYMLPLASLVSRLMGVPVWLQLHGIEAWEQPSRTVRKALAQVDFVTCVSRYTRRQFLAWSGMDPDSVRVLPNTVASGFIPGDRDESRRVWQLGSGPVLLTVGRLAATERYKGHDRVLRCLPELLRSHPTLLYLIAGKGGDRGRLEQLVLELGVAKAVRFVGEVGKDALASLFNAADLFVMPSTGEGFGIVYLEAMACGTAALGLDGDGSRDALRDGDLGFVTTEAQLPKAILHALALGRPDGLAERVRAVFDHAAFARQVGPLLDRAAGSGDASACAA